MSGQLIQTIPHKKEHHQHITQFNVSLATVVEAMIEVVVEVLVAVALGGQNNKHTGNGSIGWVTFKIRLNPKTEKYSRGEGGRILQQACDEIYTQTGHNRIPYLNKNITPAPAPITDINRNFPAMQPKSHFISRLKCQVMTYNYTRIP